MHFPVSSWSSLDGSRTLNRMLWDWLLKAPEDVQRSFFMSAAKPYTALSKREQKQWADNIRIAEKRFRTEITIEAEKPLISKLRTPTP